MLKGLNGCSPLWHHGHLEKVVISEGRNQKANAEHKQLVQRLVRKFRNAQAALRRSDGFIRYAQADSSSASPRDSEGREVRCNHEVLERIQM